VEPKSAKVSVSCIWYRRGLDTFTRHSSSGAALSNTSLGIAVPPSSAVKPAATSAACTASPPPPPG